MRTIGQNIAFYRKKKGITQEKLAEICEVTPQAVSKWENDLSCPDVMLLKQLARAFGISVDVLLEEDENSIVDFVTEEISKGKLLKMRVIDEEDKVMINLPIALMEIILKNKELKNSIHITDKNLTDTVDFEKVMELASMGVIGKILEVQSGGALVEIWIE
ncbi:MAG: helix-turn-helix transcriptional regulator [Clostridia bacterium]|nr:helix-turn-helix transcriptional regulator [Clostridia bacterium]